MAKKRDIPTGDESHLKLISGKTATSPKRGLLGDPDDGSFVTPSENERGGKAITPEPK